MVSRNALEESADSLAVRRFAKDYKRWLIHLVDGRYYKKLFDILYETEFTWVVPFDENCAKDGIDLRWRFQVESGNESLCVEIDDFPCSVLEMLIGFAFALEERMLYDYNEGDRTSKWFWMMLDNLGLAKYDDEYINLRHDYRSIKDTLNMFLDREYEYNGVGGLFPLRKPSHDQRDVEIWQQANQYAIQEIL